jgi:hypothetical protein
VLSKLEEQQDYLIQTCYFDLLDVSCFPILLMLMTHGRHVLDIFSLDFMLLNVLAMIIQQYHPKEGI